MRQAYLCAHSVCSTITMSEWGPPIGPDDSQSQCRERVTRKPLHLSPLTWYFTWLSADPASHYLSNRIYNWGTLCPVSSSSQGVPLYLTPHTQRQGAMAVANFQYITRMSSGFKVYILEGKIDHYLSFNALCCLMSLNTWTNLICESKSLYCCAMTFYFNVFISLDLIIMLHCFL